MEDPDIWLISSKYKNGSYTESLTGSLLGFVVFLQNMLPSIQKYVNTKLRLVELKPV